MTGAYEGVVEMFSLILPKRIKERLEEEARRLGVSEDEIVLEALSKQFDEALDPESRVCLLYTSPSPRD